MNTRLLMNLKNVAVYSLLITAFVITSVPTAQAESIFLFRSADVTPSNSGEFPRTTQQKSILELDEKGDLLIQCGNARFSVAYNAPADPFKQTWHQYDTQRGYIEPITVIILSAKLSF
jgi:hypothetical protein